MVRRKQTGLILPFVPQPGTLCYPCTIWHDLKSIALQLVSVRNCRATTAVSSTQPSDIAPSPELEIDFEKMTTEELSAHVEVG